ncbi:MAG: hypothetical protein E7325_02285 [Clostridiales bacterium]|nr:hypothetical protein [Clostridiales bacterium]
MNRKELAKKCREVERAGDSVLEYLHDLGYVSPGGTWWRLQVEELGRSREQITDGSATGKAVNGWKRILTPEVRATAEKMILEGKDPTRYLLDLGSRDPKALIWKLRKGLIREERIASGNWPVQKTGNDR